jgi:putative oxidoreductase
MDLKRLVFGNATLGNRSADFGVMVLRGYAGLTLAFVHGSQKMPPPQSVVDVMAHHGLPLPLVCAWAASLSEVLGGLLLALGLLTRPAAFCIAVTMGVAVFLLLAGQPFAAKELALLYFVIGIAFVFTGSGRFGLDAWIGSGKK